MTAEVGLLSSLSLLFFFFTTDMVYGVPQHTITIIHNLTGNQVAIRG